MYEPSAPQSDGWVTDGRRSRFFDGARKKSKPGASVRYGNFTQLGCFIHLARQPDASSKPIPSRFLLGIRHGSPADAQQVL
jgi:hypothetical protein